MGPAAVDRLALFDLDGRPLDWPAGEVGEEVWVSGEDALLVVFALGGVVHGDRYHQGDGGDDGDELGGRGEGGRAGQAAEEEHAKVDAVYDGSAQQKS